MPEFEENHKPPADRAPQAASAELGPFAIPPVPPELLVSPLDYLYAENCRILRLCDALDMVAADPGRVGHLSAPALIDFLRDRSITRLISFHLFSSLFPSSSCLFFLFFSFF